MTEATIDEKLEQLLLKLEAMPDKDQVDKITSKTSIKLTVGQTITLITGTIAVCIFVATFAWWAKEREERLQDGVDSLTSEMKAMDAKWQGRIVSVSNDFNKNLLAAIDKLKAEIPPPEVRARLDKNERDIEYLRDRIDKLDPKVPKK